MMDVYSTTENFTRRALWAQIDLDAAAHNMQVIRRHVGPDVRIAAVVKANAYGHGAVKFLKIRFHNRQEAFVLARETARRVELVHIFVPVDVFH